MTGWPVPSRPFAMLPWWPAPLFVNFRNRPCLDRRSEHAFSHRCCLHYLLFRWWKLFFLFTPSTHRWRFGQQTRTACRSRWTVDVKNDGPHYNWDVFFLFFVSSTIILSIDRDRIVCFCSTCARVGEAFSLLVAERSIWQMKSNVTSPLEEF